MSTSCKAKCSASTCSEFSRRNFSFAEIVLKVTVTSPFIFLCKHAISVASMSALSKASKTDFAVVILLGVKKAVRGRCGITFSDILALPCRDGYSWEAVLAAREAYESPLTTWRSSVFTAFVSGEQSTGISLFKTSGISLFTSTGISSLGSTGISLYSFSHVSISMK